MSEEILSGRIEKADISLPFSPSLQESYDTQPIFRVVLDVSESSALGALELGYYIKVNESVFFVRKKSISVFTNAQTERVLQFLKKTQTQFTINIRHDKTNSGHQYVELTDISDNSGIYTVREFQVFRSLWQTIEGELYENMYSPAMARFTDSRLIWYTKLMPERSVAFTHASKITLNYVDSQGHLEVYKLEKEGEFVIPNYLFAPRENPRFYNHEIRGKLDVIPLGVERRIIAIPKETQIISEDHDPITLDAGQYLLFHPRPQKNRAD